MTISTTVAYLVDTNVLVYRFDARFPAKQERATAFLERGIVTGDARIAHQAVSSCPWHREDLEPVCMTRGSSVDRRREGLF